MFQNPPPAPSHHTHASVPYALTPHYAVRSVIHAQTGSAPPQKKGDSQQLDATAQDPEHQHQRSQHLQSQLQRQHHRYLDPHRPTSDRQAADPEDDEVQVAPQVQVRTREVEAVLVTAVAVAVVEATVETVEIAAVQVAVVVLEAAVEQVLVPMETHR
jgi:hypothetical protein